MSYRVELPVFSGPLDLLLHLVKQQEVDVHEVRIAEILEQYLDHLKVLEALDLGDLGEFLVTASTLMEIKSRELLPRGDVEEDDEVDPRSDLIRQLLEYKRFRDVSRRLDRFAARRARMEDAKAIPAPSPVPEVEDQDTLDLGELEVWNLTEIFSRLLEETGLQEEELEIGVDSRGMEFYVQRVLDQVRQKREVDFRDLFHTEEGKFGMIGSFIAILEMMKQGVLRGAQGDEHGQIVVIFTGEASVTPAEILSGGKRLDDEELGDGEDEPGAEDLPADAPPAAEQLSDDDQPAAPGA
ncbi:MAG: segregation/condensation protein A [Planctomycetota bacterium]